MRYALGMAVDEMVAARRLDGALDRLGAGIGEEDLVGEGQRGRASRPARSCSGNAEEVGDVPELPGLLGQRRDQSRMGVAERVDGDAAGEVEKASAVGGLEPGALAAREGERRTRERVVER